MSPNIAGYKLYYGTSSRTYGTNLDVRNVTAYTVTNLNPGTYYFAVTAYDATGAESGYSNEVSTSISNPGDTQPPVISGVSANSIGVSSAVIVWTTNELSDSQVEFGTTTGYGNSTALNSTRVTSHSMSLSGLNPGTVYHYRVRSHDAAGNLAVSGNFTFNTAVPTDTTAPVISAVASSGITSNSATIRWTTNELSNTQVEYGTTTTYGSSTALNTALVTSHSQALTGLTANTTYNYRVRSRDASGNLAVSGNFTFKTAAAPDTTAPVISSVASSNVTTSSATITWTTNEGSNTQVEYGTTTAYGSSTTLNTAMVTSHSQGLSVLSAGTTYHYRVKSADAAGNVATSGDFTFTTKSENTTGLAAAYPFDEGSGSQSADVSGNGNTASLSRTSWTSGRYGRSLSFNGSSSYAAAGTAQLPAFNQPKTISFWMYVPSRSTSTKAMVSLGAAGATLKVVHRNTQVGVLGHNDTWMMVANRPSLRAWHHVGYVFDGTQQRLYIDGKLAATSSIKPAGTTTPTSFQIGRSVTSSQYFYGRLDDVRVYRGALSQTDLRAVMSNSAAGVAAAAVAAVAEDEVTQDEELGTEDPDLTVEPAVPPASTPVVTLDLGRDSYHRGETVSTRSLWISNPSNESRTVEVKTWITLPGMQPVALDMLGEDTLELTPGYDQNFGSIPVLRISGDSPVGTGAVNVRLIDHMTGQVLAEDLNPFSVMTRASRWRRAAAIDRVREERPVMTLERAVSDSPLSYAIANRGSDSAAAEIKIWLESAEGNRIQMTSAGTDAMLVLPAGESITLDPLTAIVPPAGTYVIKANVFDAASGELLQQLESEVTIP